MSDTPWWDRAQHARRRPLLLARAAILTALRRWFAGEGFVEVETPALQVSPGLEPHLEAFATELHTPGESPRVLRLHTSPEFAMKKLLAAGETRIFQLARVFRNGERSATHHPEFCMLEWYRADADYHALMEDCAAILAVTAHAALRTHFHRGEAVCDPLAEPERLSLAAAFDRFAGIDLAACLESAPALAHAARASGLRVAEGLRWDELFHEILLDRIEPHLGIGRPTLLFDYPAALGALARTKPSDPRWAERVELYVAGLELANGFSELRDPAEQRRRFEADMDLKQALYGERYPIDEDFLSALSAGMPDCAGMALGVERLVMLATGAPRIEDVCWAPVVR